MNGFSAMRPRCFQDAVNTQITLGRWSRTQVERFIRPAHVGRGAVRVGKDGYRADPHLAQRAHNAHGDLPSIGNEDFLEHYSSR